MDQKPTPYTVLGVAEDADSETIKRARRELAKLLHPDATGGDAEKQRQLQEVNEAYNLLIDPVKRAEVDRVLAADREMDRHIAEVVARFKARMAEPPAQPSMIITTAPPPPKSFAELAITATQGQPTGDRLGWAALGFLGDVLVAHIKRK